MFTTHSKSYFHKPFGKPGKVKFNVPKKVQYNREQDSSHTKGVGGLNAAIKKNIKCFSCKKTDHMKRDCLKYKFWLEKCNK